MSSSQKVRKRRKDEDGSDGKNKRSKRAAGSQNEVVPDEKEHNHERKRQKNHQGLRSGRNDNRRESGRAAKPDRKYWVTESVGKETAKYFAELAPLLEKGGSVDDPEEREVLVANALEEAEGKEVALACDPSCSKVIEGLLKAASAESLVAVLTRVAPPRFVALALHPAGSHTAEAILGGLHSHLLANPTLRDALLPPLHPIIKEVAEASIELLGSPYGSHSLRSLLRLLRGGEVEPPPKERGGSGGLLQRLSRQRAPLPSPAPFPDLLERLAQTVLETAGGKLWDLIAAPPGSAAIQALVRAVGGSSSEVGVVAAVLGCARGGGGGGGQALEGVDPVALQEMMQDRAASHLVEVIVSEVGDALYGELLDRVFQGRVAELALHPTANFCVQSLLTAARTADQVEALWGELGGCLKELLAGGRAGVVAALVAACGRCNSCQKEVCRGVAVAVCDTPPTARTLIPSLLHLDSPPNQTPPRISPIGAALLQTLLTLPEGGGQQWWESLAALEGEEAVAAARHSAGSRALEAFFTGPAPPKHKARLISKLRGSFAALVREPAGSFCVEAAFRAADIRLKGVIAGELGAAAKELEATRHGPFLLHKCAVQMYMEQPEAWKQHVESREGLRRAFQDMLEEPNQKKGMQTPHAVKKERRSSVENEKPAHTQGTEDKKDVKVKEKAPKVGHEVVIDEPLEGILSSLGVQVKKGDKERAQKKQKQGGKGSKKWTDSGEAAVDGELNGGRSDEIDALFSEGPKGLPGKPRNKSSSREEAAVAKVSDVGQGKVAGLEGVMEALEGGSRKRKRHKKPV